MFWRKRAFWLGTKYVFLKLRGRGCTWYGTSAQSESHFTCSSPRCAPQFFLGILKGPGEGRGGAAQYRAVPLRNPNVASLKATLSNAVKAILGATLGISGHSWSSSRNDLSHGNTTSRIYSRNWCKTAQLMSARPFGALAGGRKQNM